MLHTIARMSTMDKYHVTVEGVRDFYKGRSVFVTGATGLVGKVLVEKLLWSCPDIKAIYVLLRPKKNEDAKIRSTKMIGLPIFDRMRSERPNDLDKIIPVAGDLTERGLGLSHTYRDMLTEEVSVVIHSAANIKLNEELKVATHTNLVGTKRVAELCRSMPNLQAFVHVSTAFGNCNRKEICEEVYPPPYDPEKAMLLVDAAEDEMTEKISTLILSRADLPNTYTLTKSLAENMLASNYSDLPVDIVRPSSVFSSFKEPFPGWIDGKSGLILLHVLGQRGIIRVLPSNSHYIMDLIPVDIVANCILCAAWRRVVCPPETTPLVYNICSGSQNPITYGKYFGTSNEFMRKHSTHHLKTFLQSNEAFYTILASALESFPAYVSDAFIRLSGRQPNNVLNDERKREVIAACKFFLQQEWRFTDDNVRDLLESLSANDRKTFLFDVKKVHWHYYVETVLLGMRRFVLKDENNGHQIYF